MPANTVEYNTFSDQYLIDRGDAFNELLILSQAIGVNTVAGKQSKLQYEKGRRLFVILNALDCPELTAKEIESLEYCLVSMTESLFTDGIIPVYEYNPTEDDDFLVGTGTDGGDQIGTGDDQSEFANIT